MQTLEGPEKAEIIHPPEGHWFQRSSVLFNRPSPYTQTTINLPGKNANGELSYECVYAMFLRAAKRGTKGLSVS